MGGAGGMRSRSSDGELGLVWLVVFYFVAPFAPVHVAHLEGGSRLREFEEALASNSNSF